MRHVVFGADTTIGSAIIRILSTLGVKQIIACSTTGHVPDGVDKRRIDDRIVDLLDAYSIYDLLEEGDIVYNTQIVDDDTAEFGEASLYNNVGLINLLGIATQAQVKRIVTYLPQQMGWDIPDNSDEETLPQNSSPMHRSLKQSLKIIKSYHEGEDYGWNPENLAKFIRSAEETSKSTEASEDGPLGDELNETGSNNNKSGPKGPQMSSPSSGPKLSTPSSGSSLSGPKMPNTTESGPSTGPKMPTQLSNSQETVSGPQLSAGPKPSTPQSDTTPNSTQETNNTSTTVEDQVEKSNEVETLIEEIQELDRINIVLARIPRLLGPSVQEPVVRFCEGIRLQRLTITGSCKQQISWINPLDAARAMIILADDSIEFTRLQYNINGFTASCIEILNKFDEINHSNLQLRIKPLFIERVKHWIKSVLSFIGFSNDRAYFRYLAYNTRQTFDDSQARKEWNWEPKYDLEKTVKDSLNWYLNAKL